jgi:hypothetical protein
LLDHGHPLVGIALHDAAQREQLELFVRLSVGGYGLAGRLTGFDLEHSRILRPAAAGEFLLHDVERCQRVGDLPLPDLRVRFPVKRAVHLVGCGRRWRFAVEFLNQPIELLERPFELTPVD